MKQEAREIVEAAKKNGVSLNGAREIGRELKEAGIALGAESVGVAELVGFRYGVSKYEFKVSDGLTRGSRIDDPKAYRTLQERGFKGIVDLTLEGTLDGQEAPKAGLHTLNVPILDNAAPTLAQMKQFLDFATNPANTPCYVHCERGRGAPAWPWPATAWPSKAGWRTGRSPTRSTSGCPCRTRWSS